MKTKKTEAAAQDQDKYILRFPEGMRQRVAEAAKQASRSMNKELIARIQQSFDRPAALKSWAPEMLIDEIEARAKAAGVDFQTMLNTVLAAGLRDGAPQVLYISVGPDSTVASLRAALDAVQDLIPSTTPIFIEHHSSKPKTSEDQL